MTTSGPTVISSLSVASSISGQARVLVIATVAGSLQTMTIPLSIIQNNAAVPLDSLTDVSAPSPADANGLVWSSAKNQWIVGEVMVSTSVSAMIAGQLGSYVTSASAVTLTQNFITSASCSTLAAGLLASYITSASVVTLIGPYITSASAVTLVANYITSASASTMIGTLTANFITSASCSTLIGSLTTNFITSASASALVNTLTTNYITSASCSTLIGTLTANFITSASASVLVSSLTANFITSAAASVLVSSLIVNMITSASASTMVASQVRVTPTIVCAATSLSIAHYGTILLVSNSVLTTIALTTTTGSVLPVGTQIPITQYGSAQVFFAAEGGVTLRVPLSASTATRGTFSTVVLVKVSVNEWLLMGDLA